jgi:hypothetical protein
MSRSTLAASVSRAAQSLQRRSIPCSAGITKRLNATYTYPTFRPVTPSETTHSFSKYGNRPSKTADGSLGAGLCKSYSLLNQSTSFPRRANSLEAELRFYKKFTRLRESRPKPFREIHCFSSVSMSECPRQTAARRNVKRIRHTVS